MRCSAKLTISQPSLFYLIICIEIVQGTIQQGISSVGGGGEEGASTKRDHTIPSVEK